MNISKKPFSHKQTPWKGSLTSPELPSRGDGEGVLRDASLQLAEAPAAQREAPACENTAYP